MFLGIINLVFAGMLMNCVAARPEVQAATVLAAKDEASQVLGSKESSGDGLAHKCKSCFSSGLPSIPAQRGKPGNHTGGNRYGTRARQGVSTPGPASHTYRLSTLRRPDHRLDGAGGDRNRLHW